MFIRLESGSLTETFVLTVGANHPFAGRLRRTREASFWKHLRICLFLSLREAKVVLAWDGALLYSWDASLQSSTANPAPDRETLVTTVEYPRNPNMQLSVGRSFLPSSFSCPSLLSEPASLLILSYFLKEYQVNSYPPILLASHNFMQMITA